jgi:GT2 family glycosyltransferase
MLVSVVVPNLNGAKLLPTCLDALRRQTVRAGEVIVVDDGSTDGSVELIRASYPEARLVVHARSLGVARAFDDGIRAATGDVVALLNNDTEAEPGWLAAATSALRSEPDVACVASKLLLFDRRAVLHSAGDFFGRDGMPGNRGVWQVDRGQFDRCRDPFGPCGAAAVYRRELFDEVGLFDESLGSYLEDVDLSFRARLLGYGCRFVPDARVYHRLSATGGGALSSYYVGRNAIWVAFQDLPTPLWRKYWPRILARQLGIAREAQLHWREPAARARFRGQVAGLRGLRGRLARRAEIQRRRRISVAALDAMLE